MAGHSHWANIKRQKERKDLKRGKVFARLSKMITIAARDKGKDPEMNPSLKLAVEKAKAEDMPKENIERAIKKGAGEAGGEGFKEFVLEIYGPDGMALILTGLTDNKNRTVSEISQLLKESGGKLAQPGSVSWLFDQKGIIELPKSEEAELEAIEAGAENIEHSEETITVHTSVEKLNEIKKTLEEKFQIDSYELGYIPKIKKLENQKQQSFLEKLEQIEDIDNIYFTIK